MKRLSWLLCIVLLPGCCAGKPKQDSRLQEKKATTAKGATTPEEAIKLLTEAAKAGDVDAFLARIADPLRTHIAIEWELAEARRAFEQALDQKFGKSEDSGPSVKEALKKYDRAVILDKEEQSKDRVVLRARFGESEFAGKELIDKILAVKEGDHWKLLYPTIGVVRPVLKTSADGKEYHEADYTAAHEGKKLDAPEIKEYLKKFQEGVTKAKADIEKIIQDVKAGKYTSREEAKAAGSKVLIEALSVEAKKPPK